MNWLHILFMAELYIMISLSANLVSGYTGLLSFANAALYGAGAYTTTLLMKKAGMDYLTSLALAIILNSILGIIITFFSIRLKDLYFTLATISFQVIVFNVLYNWESFTGGSYGIAEIPPATIFGYVLRTTGDYATAGGILTAGVIIFFYLFNRTPFVRLLECIRDRELAAISLGKNIAYFKLVCNILSTVFITIAGSLFAAYNSYIDPTSFTLNESILIINMILIGGTGNLIGPIFGACFYILLPELLRMMKIDNTEGASLQMILYSLALILIVRFRPNGLFGKFKFE